MEILKIDTTRLQTTLLALAITIAPLGCSRNNDTPSVFETDKPQEAAVSTEGFSFLYKGPPPTTYSEAPDLAKRVAAGELPPVSERLPDEPLIVPTIERIGQYGGTWHRGFTGRADQNNMDRITHDHIVYFDIDGYT